MIARYALPGIALAMPFASPAFAEGDAVWTEWKLVPEFAVGATSELKEGPVRLARLLPPDLLQLTSAAVDPTTKEELLPAGTQMFKVLHKSKATYCTSQPSKRWGGAFWRGPLAHLCMVDSDGDKGFDSYFKMRSEVPGTLIIRGAHPDKLSSLNTPAYKEIPVAEFDSSFGLYIVRWGRRVKFFVGNEKLSGDFLRGETNIPKTALTYDFNIAGADVVLTSRGKAWDISLTKLDDSKPFIIEPNRDYFRKYD